MAEDSPSDVVSEAITVAAGRSLDASAPSAEHADPQAFPTNRTIGRYVLQQRVGAGGMGLVFAARDPDLGRTVALKVLRGSGRSAESRARLQREAQALARLDHPNVVRVFDVGTARGRIYIAMEFIEGPTLERWLREGTRSWHEVLRVVLEAGRGLEAAHAMGIIHRDFKPANVLVGTDGRTRVTDFGLARGTGEPNPSSWSPGPSLDVPEVEHDLDSIALTQVGTVMGTPAYMAPEQHRGERATAQSDQYAFCLSCYEALFGRRPFSARSHRALAELKDRGKLPPLEASHVPPRVRRAVERGLKPNPADRWPSMAVLLDELERAGSPRTRGWTTIAASAAGVGVIAAVWSLWTDRQESCTRSAERITRAWSGSHRTAAAAAFERSGVDWATDAWPPVERLLDAYAETWTRQTVDACEAGKRGEGGADLLDRRMACLGDRLAELESLSSLLADADAAVVEHAMQAVTGLTPLRTCDDPPRVRGDGAARPTPAVQRQIEALQRQSTRIDVLLDAGKHDWALDEALSILDTAKQIGDVPTIATARNALGNVYESSGRYDEAIAQLEEAFWEAEAAGATRVAANAAITLVWIFGHRKVEVERSLEWGRHAQAAVDRLGKDGYDEGRLALMLGSTLISVGEHARARAEFERALDLFERSLGHEHVEVATALGNLASALLAEGRPDEARGKIERALEVYEHNYGTEHPMVANAVITLSGIEQRTGNLERSIALARRGLDIRSAVLGPRHPEIATARNNLGAAYSANGDYASAELQYREAANLLARSDGEEHPNSAAARINLGLVLERQDRHAEALEVLQPAFETLVAILPAGHAYTVYGQLGLARSELGLGRPERASPWIEPAFERCETAESLQPALCGWVSFERARVRWHTASTRDAALVEARQALELLRGVDTPGEIARAEAWLENASAEQG